MLLEKVSFVLFKFHVCKRHYKSFEGPNSVRLADANSAPVHNKGREAGAICFQLMWIILTKKLTDITGILGIMCHTETNFTKILVQC